MYIKVSNASFRLKEFLITRPGGPHHTSCQFFPLTFGFRIKPFFLQHYTFYDFIINKARGKSGPLFNFDVHDDVRLLADATKEKDESHAGKVVERSWYQRNKHIFPASRWEVGFFVHQISCLCITSIIPGFRSGKELRKVYHCMTSCIALSVDFELPIEY